MLFRRGLEGSAAQGREKALGQGQIFIRGVAAGNHGHGLVRIRLGLGAEKGMGAHHRAGPEPLHLAQGVFLDRGNVGQHCI